MNRTPGLAATVALALVLAPPTLNAHHSHANLDRNNIQRHTGIVTAYTWRMPHVYIQVMAPNVQGDVVEYSIELLHPPAMLERGWTATSFKPGDRITWEGPSDRNPNRYYSGLNWAEKGDGTRLSTDREMGPATPSTDFTGLWVRDLRGARPHYTPPADWPFTARAQALVAQFDETQNPQVDCRNPGPPKATLLPYPILIKRPDARTILIEYELRDEPRIVHLDPEVQPGAPSPLGHSIGRFEGDELVIETTNFVADRWGTHTGVDSSEHKHLIERFRLADGGLALEVTMIVTDPVYLTEPVEIQHYLSKLPDRELLRVPCTPESARLFLEGGLPGSADAR
jgi:hypothetical protein